MYEVVTAIDTDEERTLSQADALAGLPGRDLRVVLLYVFGDNPTGASVSHIGAVREAQNRLEERGIEVTLAEESGDPAARILSVARDRGADAISVAGRKRTPTGKAIFGSVTQAVLLEADRPVIVSSAGE